MDNRIVDLHVHSTESDGTFTPTEVIAEAKNAGLSAIALTDHDTATGIRKAMGAAKEAGIELPLHGWTYAEFEEACKKLTHGEGQDKVYGMYWNLVKDFNGATNFMPQMITQYGMYTDETMTATNLNNDIYKKGLQMMVDSFNEGWGTRWLPTV